MTLTYKWIDRGYEPRNPPDPRYPKGIDIDLSYGAAAACTIEVPYPANRCSFYLIDCPVCGQNALITTAGRKDDPRTVTVACKRQS